MGILPPVYILLFMGTVALSEQTIPDDWGVVMTRVYESAMADSSHQNLDYLLSLLLPDGSFSDLDYEEGGSEPFRTHGRRLGGLAYHYNIGADVTQQLISSFTFITYNAPPNTDPNWWGHVIGTPSNMWQGAVLAKNVTAGSLETDFLNRYWVNTQAGPVWNPLDHSDKMAGGNFAPRAMFAEIEGLLRGTSYDVHAQVKEGMFREFVDREAWGMNGLRPDGCLHQHSVQGGYDTEYGYLDHTLGLIYNGNYGSELLRYSSRLFTWYTGTRLDFEDETIEGLFAAYLNCNQWLFRGHTMEPSVCGRFITSGTRVTQDGTHGSVLEAGQNLLQLNRHHDAVQAALHRYEKTVPDDEYALVGHKHFFNSDLTAHQRQNYMASVRVLSNRTSRPETWTSGQNSNGFFQGDGFLTILVDAKEYGDTKHEVFQVYDWARVPGVTNLYTTDIPKYQNSPFWSERFFNNATFVGGVTDGLVGVTFMEYRRPHVKLTALKSWFFFDDVIIVLGSDINLESDDANGESVATTIDQSSYVGEHVIGQSDGEEVHLVHGVHNENKPTWLHHRGTGYVFLSGDEHLTVTAEVRLHDGDPIDVLTAWIDHGQQPKGVMLAYAVLPDADLDQTRSFALKSDIIVLSQNRKLHAVCHISSKTVGAALVSGGMLTVPACGDARLFEVTVDIPCLILATIEDSQVRVSLADPQHIYEMVQLLVSLDGREIKRTVSLPGSPNKGSSVSTVFNFLF